MTAQEAFLLARAYTKKVIEGGGALKGAPCQIQSITPITGGHRITFVWEDNAGNVETDSVDLMDGADGQAGVGISTITYKEEDAQGNYIYTITLTSGRTYDITCPKGPQGAPGADGQDGTDGADGAPGNGIASITKTGTSGLVDTYTITYTNGTTSTFTVTNGSDAVLTAGQYIEINNDTISVKRDISKTAQQIAYNFTIPSDYTLRVMKYLNGDLVDTTDYNFNSVVDPINLDSIMEVSKKPGGGFYWVVKNLIASTTQAADYSVELYALQQTTNYTQTFVTTIDADKKLIIQSELDAAINAIKDGQNIDSFADVEAALGEKADTDIVASDFSTAASYTAGDYCIYEGKFYKFKTAHSGAWAAADVDEIKIAGELSSLMSGLINQTARNRSNITNRLTNLVTAVSEQNLEKYGYKIGDYFTGASGYTYILADMDTYYGGYNNNAIVNTHHISLVVKTGANSKWAETNDTSGGYKTSTLHSFLSSTVLDNIKSDMIALFGGSTGLEHLVSHKLLWTTATSGAWAWSDNAEYISALSEPQVYGTNVWAIDGYQTGEAWKWLEVFHKFNFCEILGNIWWWLRSICSASYACGANGYGDASANGASLSGGAVGLIIFH